MRGIPDKDRLRASLVVMRHVHNNYNNLLETPTGSTFTPIGIDGDELLVTVELPDGRVDDLLRRVPYDPVGVDHVTGGRPPDTAQ